MKQQYEAVVLSPDELRRLQLTELELLIEFDRICRKHNIQYTLEGGTLLGAVRHQGFIPWDDDIDVCLLRTDYQRFCEVCKTELDQNNFFFQTHETDPGYRWGYGKLLRSGTTFVRLNQEHLTMRKCIYIDVFPMDGVPDHVILRKLHEWACVALQKTCWSQVGKYYAKSAMMRVLLGLLNHIPIRMVHACFDWLSRICSEVEHQEVRVLAYNDIRHIAKRYYVQTQDLLFEGRQFVAPLDADGWLREVYGDDYMTPPPEDQRIGAAFASAIAWNDGKGC